MTTRFVWTDHPPASASIIRAAFALSMAPVSASPPRPSSSKASLNGEVKLSAQQIRLREGQRRAQEAAAKEAERKRLQEEQAEANRRRIEAERQRELAQRAREAQEQAENARKAREQAEAQRIKDAEERLRQLQQRWKAADEHVEKVKDQLFAEAGGRVAVWAGRKQSAAARIAEADKAHQHRMSQAWTTKKEKFEEWQVGETQRVAERAKQHAEQRKSASGEHTPRVL